MSRSKHKVSRYVGEKFYLAELAARKVRRTCDDVAKVIATYEEVVARIEAA